MGIFQTKTKIYYGNDPLRYFDKMQQKKVLIVTDPFMIKFKLVQKVTDLLQERNIDYTIFNEVEPNPSVETVTKGLYKMIEAKPEAIISIGGGSAIDVAKAMIYFHLKAQKKLVDDKNMQKPLFIAIPTTSGTGSEVTAFSVVTNTKEHTKIALVDDMMIPDIAILDSQFTKSVPPSVTADTGMDVLTHALEAYVAKNASDFTEIYAKKAIQTVFQYLLKAYTNGDNLEAREKMHFASCMAGIAFTNAGLGINHSLAHAFGGVFSLSHGKSNAILLPYVIAYNAYYDQQCAQKYTEISRSLGLPSQNTKEGVISLIEMIKIFNEKMMIPLKIQEVGIEYEDFKEKQNQIVEYAMEDICTTTNPKIPTKEDLINILDKAYKGAIIS
ncbi:1-propanol dehydrogenase PduQ [Anaerophilus nitritogenes]|uniref:1-propanol dehydrogenase PduQ n=1 Tax=Anaerophilus nitritogenes TaxID=2498136 RepID=UPI00101BF1D1|nr:1-propanol dehydrogenase PduQ [Anaerophilus nitritogenes]